MKKGLFLLLLCCPLFLFSQSTTINYQISTEDFVNPERGFYRYSETRASNYSNLNVSTLVSYRNLNQPTSDPNFQVYSSLVFRYFILDNFKSSPISQSFLNDMRDDFDAARTAGVKIIVRMSYTNQESSAGCSDSPCPPYGDASKSIILQHIEQLKPLFFEEKDVIALVQMGFIGIYGENYYTDFFGDASSTNGNGQLFNQNWNDRNEVLGALLDAVPGDRMIQVRYPQLKQRYLGGVNAPTNFAALTNSEAYSETDKARLGFHNDCFLASDADFGTYFDYGNNSGGALQDTTNLKAYKAADSKFVVVGGETCNGDRSYDPFDDCAPTGRADTEMRRFHYSYLNSQFNYPDVNVDWQNDCMEDIKRELGYRFVLKNGVFSNAARPGQRINVQLTIDNEGYATPYNPRGAELVLRNTSTQQTYFAPIDSDARFWFKTVNINQDFCIPSGLPLGNYELLLHLSDLEATLYDRSEYAIRLANKLPNGNEVWENGTGYNKLGHTLVVNNSANRPSCGNAMVFSACTADLIVSRIERSIYEVAQTIESTATIFSSTTTIFEAGESILLEAPFHAEQGSDFLASIASCGTSNSAFLEIEDDVIAEEEFSDLQLKIAPNPAAQTSVQYFLPETSFVRIQLLNANGQVVHSILKEIQVAGTHHLEVQSDGRIETGLYFIRLQTEKATIVKKWLMTQ